MVYFVKNAKIGCDLIETLRAYSPSQIAFGTERTLESFAYQHRCR